MRSHSIRLTDDELRMVIIGLDVYADQWAGYSKRRKRDHDVLHGVRINSVDEKRMQELIKSDVLAADSRAHQAIKLRDHLSKVLTPSSL